MNIDIIYMKDLKKLLAYAGTRSVREYCQRNKIEIFGKNKKRYVLAVSFRRSQLSERITHLKETLGEGWLSSLKSEISLCAKLQSALDDIQNEKGNEPIKQRIKPKSKAQQNFLNEINKELLDNI